MSSLQTMHEPSPESAENNVWTITSRISDCVTHVGDLLTKAKEATSNLGVDLPEEPGKTNAPDSGGGKLGALDGEVLELTRRLEELDLWICALSVGIQKL